MGLDLTEGDIPRTVLKTSIPMIIAFFLQSAFNLVDAFFVGKISSEALAAVSISFPIVFVIISLGSGIGVGTASVVSRFIGSKNYKSADNAAEHALLIAFFIGITLGILGILTAPTLFDIIGAEGSLKDLALGYINILLIFSIFMILGMTANNILRGEGDMKTPMMVMGFSAILNMILDPIFIFNLNLGVNGAAIATVISRFVGFICIMYYIFSGRSWIRLKPKDFTYNFEYVERIFSVGIPSALSNVIMSIGMFFMTIIVGLFGTDALAAFGIGFRLDSIAVLPAMGISIAVVSIVGQNIGAGKIERARSASIKAGIMASGLMTLMGIIFYIFAEPIIALFNTDLLVIEYGASFLQIVPISYVVVGVSMCASSAFLGSGKAYLALISTIMRVILFSVPSAYLLSISYGVAGVWWGMVIGSFLGFLATMLMFYHGGWENSGGI